MVGVALPLVIRPGLAEPNSFTKRSLYRFTQDVIDAFIRHVAARILPPWRRSDTGCQPRRLSRFVIGSICFIPARVRVDEAQQEDEVEVSRRSEQEVPHVRDPSIALIKRPGAEGLKVALGIRQDDDGRAAG